MATRQVILHQNALQSLTKWQHHMLQRLLVVCDTKNNVLKILENLKFEEELFSQWSPRCMVAIALEWL